MSIDINNLPRSKALKARTHKVHDTLDNSIMSKDAFKDIAGYARFVLMQYKFHSDINALYKNTELQKLLPRLAERVRLDDIKSDLNDLGIALPEYNNLVFSTENNTDIPTALGWLYVAEGSNMGAALLRKEVAKIGLSDDNGARHLMPAPEGPAAYWRSFTGFLDAISLNPDEEERVIEGANAAFTHVQQLANQSFA